jgi:uncharacterized membrane protein YcaP (DUF421 family)
MLTLSFPWWHFVVRGLVVYIFLMFLLRLTGKRQVGQLAPFDLVLLLVLSNAVQNAMNGGDNSVTGGLISALTLVGVNYLVSISTYYNKTLAALIEGRPMILIHNGHIRDDAMRRSKLTVHELNAALRAEGHADVSTVLCAVLENNGHISVVARNNHQPPG